MTGIELGIGAGIVAVAGLLSLLGKDPWQEPNWKPVKAEKPADNTYDSSGWIG